MSDLHMYANIENNGNAIILLRQFKENFNLTWIEVAQVFGRKLGNIKNWYLNKFNIPLAYKVLLKIYLENPNLFDKYRNISFTKTISYDNEKARNNLRKFKEKYKLTWREVGEVFGRLSLFAKNWACGQENIPTPCKILTKIYIEKPRIFEKYRLANTRL